MPRSAIARTGLLIVSAAALVVVLIPATSLAIRAPRPRSAHLELDVSVWERGVSVVHTSHQSLTLTLEVRRGHASLRVSGTARGGSTALAPTGPGPRPERDRADIVIDERFEGTSRRVGSADLLMLTRQGSASIAPHEIEWRCERAPVEQASHPGAIRCVSTAPLDALPWHNGGWQQVPIVLAYDAPHNAITWDGEHQPIVSVP